MQWTFHTPNPPHVEVRFPAGDLRIDADASGDTEIDLEAGRHEEDRWKVELVERPGRPVVRIHAPSGFRGRNGHARIAIRCPAGASVDVHTASADVDTHGALGDVRIHTASGDVRIERADGPVRVDSAGGDVAVGVAAAGLEVRGASGGVSADRVGGDVRVHLACGDGEIGRAEGRVEARTASGDQALGAVGPGSVRLETVSGDLSVGVLPGIDVWMDLQSVAGEARSDLESSGEPEAGRPRLEVRMRSVSGDLRVHRAAEAAPAAKA